MEIILLEDIAPLGKAGDVVTVRDGYARNFLLPREKAVVANEANRKHLDSVLKQRSARSEKKKTEALALTAALEKLDLKAVLRVGPDGKAFGAVTAAEIAELVEAGGVKLDRHQIRLESPIKEPGVYSVPVALHPEVETKVKLTVEETSGD